MQPYKCIFELLWVTCRINSVVLYIVGKCRMQQRNQLSFQKRLTKMYVLLRDPRPDPRTLLSRFVDQAKSLGPYGAMVRGSLVCNADRIRIDLEIFHHHSKFWEFPLSLQNLDLLRSGSPQIHFEWYWTLLRATSTHLVYHRLIGTVWTRFLVSFPDHPQRLPYIGPYDGFHTTDNCVENACQTNDQNGYI